MEQSEPNSGSSGYSGGSGYSSRAESPDSRVSSSGKRDSQSSGSSQSPQRRPTKRPDSPRQLRKPTATKSPSTPQHQTAAPQNHRSNGKVELNDISNIVELVDKYKLWKARNDGEKRNNAFIQLVDALLEEEIFPESISDYRRDPDGDEGYEYFCTWCLDSLGEYPIEGWLPHDVLTKYCPESLGQYLGGTHIVQPWRTYDILKYDNGTPRTLLLTQKIGTALDAV